MLYEVDMPVRMLSLLAVTVAVPIGLVELWLDELFVFMLKYCEGAYPVFPETLI